MTTLRRRRVVVLAAIALLAGVPAAVIMTMSLLDAAQGHDAEDIDYLIAPARTHLSLCVGRVPDEKTTNADVELVGDAVQVGFDSLGSIPTELSRPTVAQGCPTPIELIGRRLEAADLCCLLAKVVDQQDASPHRLLVYLVRDDFYNAAFGDVAYAQVVAEKSCSGDTCLPQTTAIYAPQSVSESELSQAILHDLGLDRGTKEPEPTMDWASCAQGTPLPWCRTYEFCKDKRPADVDCVEIWNEAQRQLDEG